MQAKCDANMSFVDVVCQYPGSCDDSIILRQSNIHIATSKMDTTATEIRLVIVAIR